MYLSFESEPLYQSIFVKFWHFFYNARSRNMVMSRDPRSKFLNFALIIHLISGKVTKFLLEKFPTSEVISQKPHEGGAGGGRGNISQCLHSGTSFEPS